MNMRVAEHLKVLRLMHTHAERKLAERPGNRRRVEELDALTFALASLGGALPAELAEGDRIAARLQLEFDANREWREAEALARERER